MNLTISGISNLGQGFSYLADDQKNRKIFVSKTVTGDEIEVKLVKENGNFLLANLVKIIKESPHRQKAPCEYFSDCGGCELQHLKPSFYQDFKRKILSDLFAREAMLFDDEIKWSFIPEGSRRRVVFHVDSQNRCGFFRENSNDVVKIKECLILENELSSLIESLQNLAKKINIIQISAIKFDNGIALIFDIPKKPTLEEINFLINFAKQNQIISLSYRIKNDINLVYQEKIPHLLFRNIKLNLTPDIFLQATKMAQDIIIEEINSLIIYKEKTNIIDLYCGIGTYSFGVLASNRKLKVSAFEGSLPMIDLLNNNALKNDLNQNLKGFVRDLVRNPLRTDEMKKYDLAIINPPRNGALAQIHNLAKSKIKTIFYVSCNPAAFVIDAKVLLQNGYKITKIKAIDQFTYSHHLELIAIFELQN